MSWSLSLPLLFALSFSSIPVTIKKTDVRSNITWSSTRALGKCRDETGLRLVSATRGSYEVNNSDHVGSTEEKKELFFYLLEGNNYEEYEELRSLNLSYQHWDGRPGSSNEKVFHFPSKNHATVPQQDTSDYFHVLYSSSSSGHTSRSPHLRAAESISPLDGSIQSEDCKPNDICAWGQSKTYRIRTEEDGSRSWEGTYLRGTMKAMFIVGPFEHDPMTTGSTQSLAFAFDHISLWIKDLRGAPAPQCDLQDLKEEDEKLSDQPHLSMHASGFKIMSYNVWGICVSCSAPSWSESVGETRRRRLRQVLISKYVQIHQPDILQLDEVFDQKIRELQLNLNKDSTCKHAAYSPYRPWYFLSGGILVCSPHEISHHYWVSYDSAASFYERWADKGFLFVHILAPLPGEPSPAGSGGQQQLPGWNIFATHMQSTNSIILSGSYITVRREQMQMLKETMDDVASRLYPSAVLTLVLGDLNIDDLPSELVQGQPEYGHVCVEKGRGSLDAYTLGEREEYWSMRSLLDVQDFRENRNCDGQTWSMSNDWNRLSGWAGGSANLDYILGRGPYLDSRTPEKLITFNIDRPRSKVPILYNSSDLSDHFPIWVEISVIP